MQKQNYLNLYLQGLFAPIIIYDVEINQHAILHLEAMIKDGYEDRLIFEKKEIQTIKLCQEGMQHPIYCGLARNIEIKSIKGVY